MKAHHKLVHAFDITRHYNNLVTSVDNQLALLTDHNIDGDLLNESLEILQDWIEQNCDSMLLRYNMLETFIDGYDSYDLLEYSNKRHSEIKADRTFSDNFAANLKVNIRNPSIKTKAKLADIALTISNPMTYSTPVVLEIASPYHYAVIMNDRLDAASYTLRDINQNNGQPLGWTDEQKREKAKAYLDRISRLRQWAYPFELQNDVNLMVGVFDNVMAQIDTEDVLVTADYIDTNVDKVPLIRRNWSLG